MVLFMKLDFDCEDLLRIFGNMKIWYNGGVRGFMVFVCVVGDLGKEEII